jgi:hypothetical protein
LRQSLAAKTTRRRRYNDKAHPKCCARGEPVDHAHKINLKATEFLKVSGRTKVTVYETESYKQYQKNRPPPPTAKSLCESPRYDSQCFDPSGGQSVKKGK